jgi:hypothetical protein
MSVPPITVGVKPHRKRSNSARSYSSSVNIGSFRPRGLRGRLKLQSYELKNLVCKQPTHQPEKKKISLPCVLAFVSVTTKHRLGKSVSCSALQKAMATAIPTKDQLARWARKLKGIETKTRRLSLKVETNQLRLDPDDADYLYECYLSLAKAARQAADRLASHRNHG